MVWSEAKTDTEAYFRSDWKAWAGSVISSVVASWFSAYLPKLLGETTPNTITTYIGILFGAVLGLVFFVVVILIINGLWSVPAKLYRKKEIEVERTDWRNVALTLTQYSIIGGVSGWALRVENKKSLEFSKLRIRAEIIQCFVNQEKTLNNSKGRSLQYIDRTKGKVEERIKECFSISPPIEQGKYIDFVITKEVKKEPFPIYEFFTYPDRDIQWAFYLDSTIQPDMVIECEIQGNIEIGEENWGLPHIKKMFQIMNDGKILDYEN
jgi:hypothetical protein